MSGSSVKPEPTELQEDALNFEQIFQDELNAIDCRRSGQHKTDNNTIDTKKTEDPWSMNLLGLAFSGGGIRSATFNLGIIQALAQLKLLRHVDYLSTVSGGGYIGSWLSAQFYRELETTKDVTEATEKKKETLSPEKKI
jgi:predicted acylesterase/phospholipase RssA